MDTTDNDAVRRPPRWTWIAALSSLLVLAVVGLVAYLVPTGGGDAVQGGTESSATALPGDQPAEGRGEGAAPAPDATGATSPEPTLDPEAAHRARFDPPAVGSCIRLDGWRPNLAEFVDCADHVPHYTVLWSGPRGEQPPVRCHFGYNYQLAEDDMRQVCLYPSLTPDYCYSIPVDGSHVTGSSTTDTVADSLNATATPVACDGPPRAEGEVVVRVLAVVDGDDVSACPSGMRFYLEDQANHRFTCLAGV